MKIKVNNNVLDVADGLTLAGLATKRSFPDKGVAVAVNDCIVRRADWAAHILNDGDAVTVITAAYGG